MGNLRKRLLTGVMVAGMTAGPAHAGSELMGLLEVLRANGTITEAQFQRLSKEAMGGVQQAAKEAPSSKEAGAVAGQRAALETGDEPGKSKSKKSKKRQQAKVDTKGGIKVRSADGDFTAEIGGRVEVDAAFYDDDMVSLGNGTELRRVRLGMEGQVYEDWEYAVEVDFADNEAEVKDAYLQYNGVEQVGLRAGNFKEPFSLEDQTSSKYSTFMEKALVIDAFAPGRKIGVGAFSGGNRWSAAGGLFGDGVGDNASNEGDAGWGIAGRGTFSALAGKGESAHIGASGEYRRPDNDERVRFRTKPESNVTGVEFVDTGNIRDVDRTTKLGVEAAAVQGPWSLQGEYLSTDVNRKAGKESVRFDGWYLYGSWFMTGESRPFDPSRGSFGRIKPMSRTGAWELGLRFSSLDLDDKDVRGGEEDNLTLGLNWYVNPQVRFMANLIRVSAKNAGQKDEPRIFQVRGQVDF